MHLTSTVVRRLAFRLPAAAAVFALLLTTTAGAAPGLFHGDGLDHCCEFCHVGHVPVLKPSGGIEYSAPPAAVAWLHAECSSQRLELLLINEHSRAPPA